MRRLVSVALTLVMGVSVALSGEAPAGAAVCSRPWGTRPEVSGQLGAAHLVNVRAGWHGCYDRLVIDLDGAVTGYRVRYVTEVVQDGSGEPVPLEGGAFLQIVVLSPAYDDDGEPTYTPADPSALVDVDGFPVFRQVAWAGSFEGQTTIGLGVRTRLPFRVFTLDGPGDGARIVIDVARRK